MVLTEKETSVIEDLRQQEQNCVEKYKRYAKEAKDEVLRDLFQKLEKEETNHYESLGQVLNGTVPCVDCNDKDGREYQPKATYDSMTNSSDKQSDGFLVTDCIGTEKLVSGTYNNDVFCFGDTNIRKLLADIQIEEQNHAEMLWKYKTVNGMS